MNKNSNQINIRLARVKKKYNQKTGVGNNGIDHMTGKTRADDVAPLLCGKRLD